MTRSTHRILHVIALLSIAAVAIALVSQYVFGMQPCAWCVLQRLVFIVIAIICWLGILAARIAPVLGHVAAFLTALLSVGGITAAWYQYTVASQLFSCDMTFADRFMVNSGLDANLPWLFGIFATCADAKVELLGVEYALWALGLFAVTAALAVAALLGRPPLNKT